ncbi:hypothetical protein CRUP_023949, partial [Coryphaenoides rupestris]
MKFQYRGRTTAPRHAVYVLVNVLVGARRRRAIPARPTPVERERRIRVFRPQPGLIRYQKGDAPSPPPFEVYFCFGEDWPDKKPKEKKLIIVQVVPVVARILTEMFSGELDWSTDSIRLQISNPDVKDRTVEQFKEVQRLLQSQRTQQGPWGTQQGPAASVGPWGPAALGA